MGQLLTFERALGLVHGDPRSDRNLRTGLSAVDYPERPEEAGVRAEIREHLQPFGRRQPDPASLLMEAISAFGTRLTECQPGRPHLPGPRSCASCGASADAGAAAAPASANIDPKLPSLTCQFLQRAVSERMTGD
jgi:hypothetical protein